VYLEEQTLVKVRFCMIYLAQPPLARSRFCVTYLEEPPLVWLTFSIMYVPGRAAPGEGDVLHEYLAEPPLVRLRFCMMCRHPGCEGDSAEHIWQSHPW
jgi:hypothetical protein